MKKINKWSWILISTNLFLLIFFAMQLKPSATLVAAESAMLGPQLIHYSGCQFLDGGQDYLCRFSYTDFINLLSSLPDNFLIKKLVINANKNLLSVRCSL